MTARAQAADLPRHSYFHAVDRQGETEAFVEKMIPHEQGRRQKLLMSAIQDAENLISALKTTRQFDRHGNIELVLPQIADALADVVTKTRNFIADVKTCTDRYRKTTADSSEAAGWQPVEPAPASIPTKVHVVLDPRAVENLKDLAERSPKPGPHLASVTVFDPNRSQSEQLAALDRAATRRAEQLRGGRR
ncbi:hypothetical protein RI444_15300 [Paenarthrobacter sp. AT5]|uniref:hypothetical protein n=1 Tax=Paenarthrobacter TaxID=1742992 RepID=UPI001A9857FF|nr:MULTISPECIES: hypothetical protein [Paenarthrobacter]QSZ53302.1 hypothetical protein AYX19_09975 [Paenarthrobacter ureafaciens]WOC59873.1 hypothetical protein RI444_15300 [Paenarthrobacter sp. AT5]